MTELPNDAILCSQYGQICNISEKFKNPIYVYYGGSHNGREIYIKKKFKSNFVCNDDSFSNNINIGNMNIPNESKKCYYDIKSYIN